jgi:hypothetical protein
MRVRDGENDKTDFSRSRSSLFFAGGVDRFLCERGDLPVGHSSLSKERPKNSTSHGGQSSMLPGPDAWMIEILVIENDIGLFLRSAQAFIQIECGPISLRI